MQGVNKVILLGLLGADPEVRYLPNGDAVTNIRIATNESWTDKNSGAKQTKTEWHTIVFFNKMAEIAEKYLRKGSKVYVEGKLQTEKWKDKNGEDRWTTKIISTNLQLLDYKEDEKINSKSKQENDADARMYAQATGRGMPATPAMVDEDIPF